MSPTRRLSISSAGHEPAWYYDAPQQIWSSLEIAPREGLFDIPLAVEPKARYTRCLRRVTFGDRLLLLTDGAVEAPDESGELFGRERLAQVLHANSSQPPQVLIPAIVAALRGYTNQAARLHHDDVTLLMVEFVDNLKSNALWTAVRNRLLPRRRGKDASKAAQPAAPSA